MSRPSWLSREMVEDHSVDIRQFIDMRESRLPSGIRVIEAHNSSGLRMTLLPDRGMDIYSATYNGMPLTWLNKGGPFPPDGGQTWLHQFNGGLLTTCGLMHVGPPENDDVTGEFRDLHGHFNRLRAYDVSVKGSWTSANYEMKLTAEMAQSRMHGEQLAITRRINWKLGEPRINIVDFVTNHSDQAVPLMILYHFNTGYPMVRKGTELVVASDVYSRDDVAKAGAPTWNTYDDAQSGYREQVFYHHVKHDPTGRAHAALINDDVGLKFSWKTDTLPYLVQWKNTRKHMYVNGVEPGNCVPEGQNQARESGRLVLLEPDEMVTFSVTVEVLENINQITEFKGQVELLSENAQLIEGCNLSGYEKYIADNPLPETAVPPTNAIEGKDDAPEQE